MRAVERARLKALARADRGRSAAPSRPGLAAAIALPALAAASAVLALTTGSREAPESALAASPAQLVATADLVRPGADALRAPDARAEATALRPLLARDGRAGLEPTPLEPLEGGIRPAPPQRIAIPSAGVDAPVERVGTSGAAMKVPDVGRAGWYDAGPRPGERGRAVVIGHLDGRDGPGLFARVPQLPAGTLVTVTDALGELHRFNVIGGAEVRKDHFPADQLFGGSDAPVLVLITCGGPYRAGRGYRDNVLVYARGA